MNKKLLAFAAVPLLGLGLLSADAASAHGFMGMFGTPPNSDEIAAQQTTTFQKQADLLGINVSEIKTAWAEGTSLQQLAKNKGISEETITKKMQAARAAEMAAHLKALVDKGVITQAQADQRQAFLKTKQTEMAGKKGGRLMGRGGMGGNFNVHF